MGEGKNRWPTKSVNRCPKGVTNEQTKKVSGWNSYLVSDSESKLDSAWKWELKSGSDCTLQRHFAWLIYCSNVIMSVYSSPFSCIHRGRPRKGSYFSYNWAPTTSRPQTRKLDSERKQIERDWFFFFFFNWFLFLVVHLEIFIKQCSRIVFFFCIFLVFLYIHT